MSRKGTATSIIRCATSRYICFPLIFAITTISMLATVFQHSYVTSSGNLVKRSETRATFSRLASTVSYEDLKTTAGRAQAHVDDIARGHLLNFNVESLPNQNIPPMPWKEDLKRKTGNVVERRNSSTATHPEKHRIKGVNFQKLNRGIPEKLSKLVQNMSHNTKSKSKAVVIVTNYRSGSTFLGQLFNQHPDAFYSFEPLYPFGSNCSFEPERKVKTMHEMLKCNFPNMSRLYEDLGGDQRTTRTQISCVRNNFCFRYNHKDLCTRDICPKGNKHTCMGCGPVDLRTVKNKCRSRKIAAVKVIRLCYLENYKSIFEDPTLDLKVVHLVRDPRGIASSRLKIHPDWDIVENIRATCRRQVLNVKAGRNEDWLKDRYKVVRYEDLATNPIELAQEIYEFVGLPFIDSVREWISQNTQSKRNAEPNVRELLYKRKKKAYKASEDPYSTQRDSKIAMQAWRKHLSLRTTDDIQKHCYETLRSLGYYDFKTFSEQLNMNISSIL